MNKDLPENKRPVSGHPETAKIGSASDGESQPTLIKGACWWPAKEIGQRGLTKIRPCTEVA